MISNGRNILITICLGILLALSAPAVSQAGIGLSAGAAVRGFGGYVGLESGFGLDLGLAIPFSSFLELTGEITLPRKYDTSDPSGIMFATDNYERIYSSMQYFSYSAGMEILFRFNSEQVFIPIGGFQMGKAWIFGSGRDGYSGYTLSGNAGLRYKYTDNWVIQALVSYTSITLDKLKIDSYKNNLLPEKEESCNCVSMTAIYYF